MPANLRRRLMAERCASSWPTRAAPVLPVQVNSVASANFACGDMAPARPAANTIETRKAGVSIRCNGHRKTVVKTGREAGPGANPFNLPYRVRLLSICKPLPCAAGECIHRKAACKVYDAGSRAKLGVRAFRVRHKWQHEHTENRCADRVLDGRVRTSLYLALTGSLPIPKPAFAAKGRHMPQDANYAAGNQLRIQGQLQEFSRVLPELRPVKGAQMRAAERSKTLDRTQFRRGKSAWPKWHLMPLGLKEKVFFSSGNCRSRSLQKVRYSVSKGYSAGVVKA